MDYISVAVPSWLDLATVIVGALAGIIVARERHLDLVGFVGLGLLGGLENRLPLFGVRGFESLLLRQFSCYFYHILPAIL